MRLGKTMLMAGTAYLALTAPGFSQSVTNASATWATCMDVRDELRSEVQSMDDRGSWVNRVDNLISQARNSRTPAECLQTLQEANRIIGRETGDAPIGEQRFQTAQQSESSGGTFGRSTMDGNQSDRRQSDGSQSERGGSDRSQSGSSDRTFDRSAIDRSQGDRSAGTSAQSREGADTALMDSDARRVPVAFAHSIVGVSVTDSNGDPAGEIEYLVIDTDTSEIKFAVLGSGGMLDLGEEYTAVPWEQLNVGLDAGRPYADITATVDKLKEGQRLRYDTLNQLTSMQYQTGIINYWIPAGGSDQGSDMDTSQRSDTSSDADRQQRQASGTSDRDTRSGQQGSDGYIDFRERSGLSGEMHRRQQQASGSGERDTTSGQQGRQGYVDFRDRAGMSEGSGHSSGSGMDRQRQARSDSWSGSRSGASDRGAMEYDRRSSDQAASRYDQQGSSQDRQRQAQSGSSSDGTSLMLAGRQFITVLAPSSLKTGRQLRGAEVVSRDGQELGEIDRLVVDLDRGYVAYALVAQGGFLGIGEEWRPVPLAALNWRRGETYALSQSSDQLRSTPRLARAELPDRVRTADLRMLYQKYQVTPYWQQSQQQDEPMRSSSQGSGSRDRMQSDQQR